MNTTRPPSNWPRERTCSCTTPTCSLRSWRPGGVGHAAAEYAAGLGRRVGARRVVLYHHHPDRTDDALDQVARRFAASPVPVAVAAEGLTIDV